MKFMMLTYETEGDFAARTDDGQKEQYWSGWRAYIQSMKEAGVLYYSGNVLQPNHTAITVNVAEGKVVAGEGAYATDTLCQLSGFFVLDVSDRDEAVHWASLAPAAVRGTIELRPVV